MHGTSSSLGVLYWIFGTDGIHWVSLAEEAETGWALAQARFPGVVFADSGMVPDHWEQALLAAVERPVSHSITVPLVLHGTKFQLAVWDVVRAISPGCILTYAEVARRSGYPRAVRAVGNACGANPIPFLIPCHRVVSSGGRWGGYGLGLPIKETLLWREGVVRERTSPLTAHARIPLLRLGNRHDVSDGQWFGSSI